LEAFAKGMVSSVKEHNLAESFTDPELRSQELAAWAALMREMKSMRKSSYLRRYHL
jgi:hypothetical protein